MYSIYVICLLYVSIVCTYTLEDVRIHVRYKYLITNRSFYSLHKHSYVSLNCVTTLNDQIKLMNDDSELTDVHGVLFIFSQQFTSTKVIYKTYTIYYDNIPIGRPLANI